MTTTHSSSRHSLPGGLRSLALALPLTLAACTGDTGPAGPEGPAGPQGPETGLDPSLSTLDKAVTALGGRDALSGLASFQIQAAGIRSIDGEGFAATDSSVDSSSFTLTVTHDVDADALRLSWQRDWFFFGATGDYDEIIDGDLGYVDGTDNFFGIPPRDMLSDRLASARKQQRLLNPQLILRDVLADPSRATEGGVRVLDGSLHELLVVADPIAPIALFVNARTGEIAKLETIENHQLHRDSALEVFYLGWQPTDGEVAFPSDVILALGGQVLHAEARASVEVNAALSADLFAFPPGAAPQHVPADADRGARSSQFIQAFAGLGIPIEGLQGVVVPAEIAPGVFFLTGGTHHSLAIEQQNGVVIAEAPLYPERSEAIIAWAEAQFPGKPITHVIATHHHEDHSAGLRAFVARGAAVVLGAPSREVFADVFRAPSTIVPDALAQAPRQAVIQAVPVGGSILLDDPARPVAGIHIATAHSNDFVLVHLPDQAIAFQSDLYSPGLGLVSPTMIELRDAIVSLGIAVDTIAPGHGVLGTFAQLEAEIGAQ